MLNERHRSIIKWLNNNTTSKFVNVVPCDDLAFASLQSFQSYSGATNLYLIIKGGVFLPSYFRPFAFLVVRRGFVRCLVSYVLSIGRQLDRTLLLSPDGIDTDSPLGGTPLINLAPYSVKAAHAAVEAGHVMEEEKQSRDQRWRSAHWDLTQRGWGGLAFILSRRHASGRPVYTAPSRTTCEIEETRGIEALADLEGGPGGPWPTQSSGNYFYYPSY